MTTESVYNTPLVCLAGQTAVGKTGLSIDLAKRFDFEIISVDSMQIYKYMDIGTAKITEEEMCGVKHHLIDIVNPDKEYSAGTFISDALAVIEDISSRGKNVLLTGGTGLYYKSLLEGLSMELPSFPEIREELIVKKLKLGVNVLHEELSLYDRESAIRIEPNDTQRVLRALEIFKGTGVPWSVHIKKHKMEQGSDIFKKSVFICLDRDREELYERINLRCNLMIDEGFRQEVEKLLEMGFGPEHKSMRSIGYKHMTQHITGEITLDEMKRTMSRDTRRYAKRQKTWFKRMEGVQWIPTGDIARIDNLITTILNS